MTGGREPLSRPSSRHGEAHHLSLLSLSLGFARAASEIAKAGNRALNEGGNASWAGAGGKAPPVGCPPALDAMPADSVRVRGLSQKKLARRSRPQGLRDRARHQSRSLLGALRGVPAEVGVEETRSGIDQGGNLLPLCLCRGCVSQNINRKDREV